MNAAQEVPAPKGDAGGARGTSTATVTRSGAGASLDWEMTFSGLTGPAACEVARGQLRSPCAGRAGAACARP